MDKTLIIVCAVIGSLGVLSAILGFSAEGTKLTIDDILVLDDECIYPQNPAIGLGICAAVFLLAAQVTFTAVGGCCGCCKSRAVPSESKRIIGIVCAVLSWIAAVIAWALLIDGASWNANVVRVTGPVCYYLKDGIFAGGAVLTLAATALAITSYVMLRRQPGSAAPAVAHPATAQPQFPAAPSSKPNEQLPPPHAAVALGQPQYWPAAAAVHQAPPPAAGNAAGQQAHQQQQSYPPAPAANTPAEHHHQQQLALAAVPMGHGHPQFSPPPAYAHPQAASYPPQYGVQPQVYVQVPVAAPTVAPPQEAEAPAGGVRGEDLVKAGAKLLMRVVESSLSSSDNNNNNAAQSNGDGVQTTDGVMVV